MNTKGFTLVEIMIVVAIIGLLTAIAIPNFVGARNTAIANTCEANERTLQGLVEIGLFDGVVTAGVRTAAQLAAEMVPTYIRAWPTCLEGTYGKDGQNIVDCTSGNH